MEASTGNDIESKDNQNVIFTFDEQDNSEDLMNTNYYLELENEVDLGLREDTDYILVKTEDNEFKFCEITADENNVFQLQSSQSKTATKDSMATEHSSKEFQEDFKNKQASCVLSQVESGAQDFPVILNLPEASAPSDGREFMHSVDQIEHSNQQPMAFQPYLEFNSSDQPAILSENFFSEAFSTSPGSTDASESLSPKPMNGSVEQLMSNLYNDMELKYFTPRRRGRPRKSAVQEMPLMRRPLSSNAVTPSNFNIKNNEIPRITSAPVILKNIHSRDLNLKPVPGRRDVVENLEPQWKIKSGNQMMDYREYQKMQDKNRRSRIKAACQTFRTIVPGITRRTDSTSVWEQSVQYLAFIKQHIGNKYDMEFLGF